MPKEKGASNTKINVATEIPDKSLPAAIPSDMENSTSLEIM